MGTTNNKYPCVIESNIVLHEFNDMIRYEWCQHVIRCVDAFSTTNKMFFESNPLIQPSFSNALKALVTEDSKKTLSFVSPWNVLVMEKGTDSLKNLLFHKQPPPRPIRVLCYFVSSLLHPGVFWSTGYQTQ
jgi:hypothetical protein